MSATGEDGGGLSIEDIMASMGVDSYDPLVSAAILEYARRKKISKNAVIFSNSFNCMYCCCLM
jgi:hypothetical protein